MKEIFNTSSIILKIIAVCKRTAAVLENTYNYAVVGIHNN
jgi:hypothetical protein